MNNYTTQTTLIKTTADSQLYNKPKGRYTTIQSQYWDNNGITILASALRKFTKIRKASSVLIVGIGNRAVTPDSLGPLTADKVFATAHIADEIPATAKKVTAFSPSVQGMTGMETADIIQSIVNTTKPDLVIAIDALASNSLDRLNTTVQITDTGINIGAGLKNPRKSLNKDTLGVPVIAIGVPLAIMANNMDVDSDLVFCTKDIDEIIAKFAKIISCALNMVLLRISLSQALSLE